MLVFEWSWFSFVIGFFAAVTVAFWSLVIVAYKQWKRNKQQQDELSREFSSLFKDRG